METLEKMARALEVSMYYLMYDGDTPPQERNGTGKDEWGSHGKDARFLNKLCQCLSRMSEGDRELLMRFVRDAVRRK